MSVQVVLDEATTVVGFDGGVWLESIVHDDPRCISVTVHFTTLAQVRALAAELVATADRVEAGQPSGARIEAVLVEK